MAVTWALQPERYSVTVSRRVLSSPAASGFVHSRQTNTTVSASSSQAEARVFSLEWEYADRSEWTTVQGYLDDTFGGVTPLAFTPPQAGSAINCRIVSFRAQSNHPKSGVRMTVELEEVL